MDWKQVPAIPTWNFAPMHSTEDFKRLLSQASISRNKWCNYRHFVLLQSTGEHIVQDGSLLTGNSHFSQVLINGNKISMPYDRDLPSIINYLQSPFVDIWHLRTLTATNFIPHFTSGWFTLCSHRKDAIIREHRLSSWYSATVLLGKILVTSQTLRIEMTDVMRCKCCKYKLATCISDNLNLRV